MAKNCLLSLPRRCRQVPFLKKGRQRAFNILSISRREKMRYCKVLFWDDTAGSNLMYCTRASSLIAPASVPRFARAWFKICPRPSPPGGVLMSSLGCGRARGCAETQDGTHHSRRSSFVVYMHQICFEWDGMGWEKVIQVRM